MPVSGCASALARRVTLRGGRNARPVSPGPSGPTRGQAGAPAGRPLPFRALPAARRRRPRTNELDAGVGPDGRVVFPPGEGIGRTRPGAGSRPRRGRSRPRTLPAALLHPQFRSGPPGRSTAIPGPRQLPRMGPCRGPLIPPLMGPPTPPLMGPPGGEGASGAGLGPFALVRTLAGQGHGQKPARDPAPLRYVGVRPIDSSPVDGPPSSAHSGRNRGGRTIQPALRAGRAIARISEPNLRRRRHSRISLRRSMSLAGPLVAHATNDPPGSPWPPPSVAMTPL